MEDARRPHPDTGEFLSVSAFATTIHGFGRDFEPKQEKFALSTCLEKGGGEKGEVGLRKDRETHGAGLTSAGFRHLQCQHGHLRESAQRQGGFCV